MQGSKTAKSTGELMALRRELSAAIAVLDFAVKSNNIDQCAAAVRIVKGDLRRMIR